MCEWTYDIEGAPWALVRALCQCSGAVKVGLVGEDRALERFGFGRLL